MQVFERIGRLLSIIPHVPDDFVQFITTFTHQHLPNHAIYAFYSGFPACTFAHKNVQCGHHFFISLLTLPRGLS